MNYLQYTEFRNNSKQNSDCEKDNIQVINLVKN